MAQIIRMPKLGMTMEAGTISRWVKSEGESVAVGEVFVEVENDKAIVELPSEHAGILRKILAPEGAVVPVSGAIAIVGAADEQVNHLLEAEDVTSQALPGPVPQRAGVETSRTEARTERINASPVAKKLAAEQGIDLSGVQGTGPGGQITKEDVLRVSAAAGAAPKILRTFPVSAMRKLIGQVVSASKRNIPHFYVTADVDMTSVMGWRDAAKKEKQEPASILTIVAHAVCEALKEHPIINSTIEGDLVRVYDTVNLGITVALEDGLVIANLAHVENKSLNELNDQMTRTLEKFRGRKYTAEDCRGSTFTISNLGHYGVREFAAIIHPPESAILALGRCEQRMVVREGRPEIRWIMSVTMSCDHRVIDGAMAAEFLDCLYQKLASFT